MKWGPQQQSALAAVNKWLKNPSDQVFRLFGWAGTGKTTLAKHFAGGVDRVLFGAYTGKAALVLRQKGCPDASTIHSMIYRPAGESDETLAELRMTLLDLKTSLSKEGLNAKQINANPRVSYYSHEIEKEEERLKQPRFTLNPDSDVNDVDLIVIDEVTMVDQKMGEDLMSFEKPILVLGDPGQLPPVGAGGYFTKQKPDVLLTEVHRQAKDNPIVQLATMIRNQKMPALGQYGASEVITKESLKERTQDAASASIVLVGMNKTRHWCNKRLREMSGFRDVYPVAGDQLVCLKNNHECGLLNGGLWDVQYVSQELSDDSRRFMKLASQDEPRTEDVESLSLIFRGEDPREADYFVIRGGEWFDYGRALTVHKSQGSQWPDGIVIDESHVFRSARWNHLYTAVTRFSERQILAISG